MVVFSTLNCKILAVARFPIQNAPRRAYQAEDFVAILVDTSLLRIAFRNEDDKVKKRAPFRRGD